MLQDDFVLLVIVACADERWEEHSDESRVAEILERQLTQFLQHAGLAARLHDHLIVGVVNREVTHTDDKFMEKIFRAVLRAEPK